MQSMNETKGQSPKVCFFRDSPLVYARRYDSPEARQGAGESRVPEPGWGAVRL